MTNKIEAELVKATSIKPSTKDRQGFIEKVVKFVNGDMSEDQFRALSPEAQKWFASAMEAWNTEGADLPEFPDDDERPRHVRQREADAETGAGEESPRRGARTSTREEPTMPKTTKTEPTTKRKPTVTAAKTTGRKPAAVNGAEAIPARRKAAAPAAEPKRSRVPLGEGAPTIIKRAVIKDPAITNAQLHDLLTKKGHKASPQTISSIRSTFRHGIAILKEAGLVKQTLEV